MIQAIIFDVGGVIVDFDKTIFLKNISKHSPYNIAELNKLIYGEGKLEISYQSGKISSEQFYKLIKEICRLNMSMKEFARAYGKIHTVRPVTVEIIKQLSGKYNLHLLSNTGEWHYEEDWKHLGFREYFNSMSLSYLVKSFKPDKKIYLDALEKLKCEPEQAIYIDDIRDFAEAASKLGMHAIHYIGHKELIRSLKGLGVEI